MTRYGIILSDDGELEWMKEWKGNEWVNTEFETVREAEAHIIMKGRLGKLNAYRAYIARIEKSFRIKTKESYDVEEEK